MPISEEILQQIANNDPTLTNLDLSDSQIGDAGAERLANALLTNTTLTSLDLSSNQIGDAGAERLANALLTNKTLTSLGLYNNQIGVAGAERLANALLTNKTLTTLSLSDNHITDAGSIAIANALLTNKTLTTLSLSDNHITDAGSIAIANALLTNNTLKVFHLSRNQIGVAGAIAMADALLTNNTLKVFHLSSNQITDVGAIAIANALLTNTTLISLDLFDNQITDVGAERLINALENNTTITGFYFFGNQTEANNVNAIESLMVRNRELPTQISNKIYQSLIEKDQGQNQQNPVVLSEIEKRLITISPKLCLKILNQFLRKPDISTRNGDALFNHIKEFPLGERMLMSSAKLGLDNLTQIPQDIKSKLSQLNLSDLFALKGVAKNTNDQDQTILSTLPTDMFIKILSYLQIDDIKKSNPLEAQLSSQAGALNAPAPTPNQLENTSEEEKSNGEEEESKEEVQTRQSTTPNTSPSTTDLEATRLDGCLPTKSCTIS